MTVRIGLQCRHGKVAPNYHYHVCGRFLLFEPATCIYHAPYTHTWHVNKHGTLELQLAGVHSTQNSAAARDSSNEVAIHSFTTQATGSRGHQCYKRIVIQEKQTQWNKYGQGGRLPEFD